MVANLGNPASSIIVNGQGESGVKHRTGLVRKTAPREINAAKSGSGETAARAEQRFHRRAENSRVGAFKVLNAFGTESGQRLDRQRIAIGVQPSCRNQGHHCVWS
jgi:hypothetical protein